jgi:hypothetical protein
MFRLSRVIFRAYKEQIQGYLSVSCTLGSQALTKCGVVIITVYISSYNTRILNYDQCFNPLIFNHVLITIQDTCILTTDILCMCFNY